jgi:septal ring factor EnvC (AmiA/AmiB activator)
MGWFSRAWRAVTAPVRAVVNVVKDVTKTVVNVAKDVVDTTIKVGENIARGAKDIGKGIARVTNEVVETISGAKERRKAREDLARAEAEQREAQEAYDAETKRIEADLAEQKRLSQTAQAEQDAAQAEATRIEQETQEKTRIAALESKKLSASSTVQARITEARELAAQREAALAAELEVPEEEGEVSQPTITRTPISTPSPGGYGGTDPGAINPTGLNI